MSLIDGDSAVQDLLNVRHPSQLPYRGEIKAARAVLENLESHTDQTVVIASEVLTKLRGCLNMFATTTTLAIRAAASASAWIASFGENASQPVVQARQSCQRHLQSLVDSLQDEERKQAMFSGDGVQWRTLLAALSQDLTGASEEGETLSTAENTAKGVLFLHQFCRKLHSELHPETVLPDDEFKVLVHAVLPLPLDESWQEEH